MERGQPEVPPAATVEVNHRGRFREDGSLRGTIAGRILDLTLQLPFPFGSVSGTLGDAPVSVAWALHTGDSRISTLRGVVGSERVDIEGVFRRRVEYQQGQPVLHEFMGASLQGTLAGEGLSATIETDPPDPLRGISHEIAAIGTLGHWAFQLFAGRGIRGNFDDQAVHLDIAGWTYEDARVVGTCPGPPTFSALVVAALLFFA